MHEGYEEAVEEDGETSYQTNMTLSKEQECSAPNGSWGDCRTYHGLDSDDILWVELPVQEDLHPDCAREAVKRADGA